MQEILTALGKDCLMFIDSSEFPLPHEYRFLSLSGLVSSPPDDLDERTIVFLDCGNLERNPAEAFQRPGVHILNIDHHHDNTHFGTVEPRRTRRLVHRRDRVGSDARPRRHADRTTIAEALYVGLITDTGRFMYENTGPRAHLMAAELIEAGVDVHEIYRRVYEGVPYGKLALLARGLAKVRALRRRAADGDRARTPQDFAESGAEESYSEGVIDHLRAVQGTAVAALIRDRIGDTDGDGKPLRKVSLRASDERVDVSAIARAQGGGGHRQAAGFTTALEWDELVAFLREEVAQQLS